MTQISTLGEFGLIKRLTKDIELKNPETKKGVGDDCAVLAFDGEKEVLVTTDMLMEGVHFDLTYMPLKHLGYKSAIVNFSTEPNWILTGFSIPVFGSLIVIELPVILITPESSAITASFFGLRTSNNSATRGKP